MIDARHFDDSEGVFGEWKKSCRICPKCVSSDLVYRSWDSNCGGYTDYQYKCEKCKRVYWVEGPDS